MANICEFSMLINGEPQKLLEVRKIFLADYDYSKDKVTCTEDYHVFRTWVDEDVNDTDVSHGYLSLCGECAWSVATCMLEEGYYQDYVTRDGFKGITLNQISERYGVDIEVYSKEYGMAFEEHYLIKNGKFEIDDVVSFESIYDEASDDWIGEKGGFGEWQFSI